MLEVEGISQVEMEPECHLVTGGGGYVGYHLGMALHRQGHKVILLDVQTPADALPDDVTFIKCSITEYDKVEAALRGVNFVYHLASYGMSGREQLNRTLIEKVNIEGSENIVKACRHNKIEHLVYTSTYNVVFGGQKIVNGDESLPYLPLDDHLDHYSRTKSIAESAVLDANGSDLDNEGGQLRTCALRLAGVYGPGERRHLPRIVGYIEKGLFAFTYGEAESLVEFLHIDNLVQAHIKAGRALTAASSHVAAGQAYFISDGKPVNNFIFFKPLVEGLGYKYPTLRLPMMLIYFIALLNEVVHSLVGRVYNFQLLLTRTEVLKTGVTHYFSNNKAFHDFGYKQTVQNDMDSVTTWYLEKGFHRKHKKRSAFVTILWDMVLVMLFVTSVMSLLPMVK